MGAAELPAEIWTEIFDLAADEDVILQYGLPTVMAESAWFKTIFGEWALRTPQEAVNSIQRRSYSTKKAIISTCKSWNIIGSKLLFRCLFFDHPAKLQSLCTLLSSSPASSDDVTSRGWYTKRIHLTRYYPTSPSTSTLSLLDSLTFLINRSPNLMSFVIDWPLGPAFGPIAAALATSTCASLNTLSLVLPASALPKFIWALASLPALLAVHVEFETPSASNNALADADDEVLLGAASDLHLTLPRLIQLSLRGHFPIFLEQATGWSLPSLRSLSLDTGTSRVDIPDFLTFLIHHGSMLVFLDLNCIPQQDVAAILDVCPLLSTFCFNADWRLVAPADGNEDETQQMTVAKLVNRPHPNITTIGLHSLIFAFNVGYPASYSSLSSHIVQHSNDLNFAALTLPSIPAVTLAAPASESSPVLRRGKLANFPNLKRIRVLSRNLLLDLNNNNGPDEGGANSDNDLVGGTGMERWERWWGLCSGAGVRLEDCTGDSLGELPQDADDAEEVDESEEGDDDDDDASGTWDVDVPEEKRDPNDGLEELRKLLEECRIMEETREPMYVPPGWE